MRRIPLLGVLLLCGCATLWRGPVTSARRINAVANEWDSIETDSSPLGDRTARVQRFVRRHGALLPFWPADSLSEARRGKMKLTDHPCGESTVALVRRIPVGHRVLDNEWMYELDASGTVVGRWPVPTDRMPVAVRGDELVVTGPAKDILLAVRPNGTFRFRADLPVAPLEPFECPKLAVLSQSDYAACAVFVDNGVRRRIAFERVCT